MVNAISSVGQTQPVTQSQATKTQKPAKPAPKPAAADSVQLSSAAQARAATLQEVRETSSQTSKEASRGDRQAQRLLTKESAKR
jgi:hypothetical protein